MREYLPKNRTNPSLPFKSQSAWGDIPEIILDIINTFQIRNKRALEFGVEWGYSTSALASYFDNVTGVDTFVGDINCGYKNNHLEETRNNLKDFNNIDLIQSTYEQWITKDNNIYDLIHIDIIHDFENTYRCGEWAIRHTGVCIFHDTVSFPEVMRACTELANKYNLEFWNYPHSNGLGILINKRFISKKFSFGWISHDSKLFNDFLFPSLKRLNGNFDVFCESDNNCPAYGYNKIIDKCETRWLILTHEDVAFSYDLLSRIDLTISHIGVENFGFCCLSGTNSMGLFVANQFKINGELQTCDSCFIVIDTNNPTRFDAITFDDFHCQVEDYCVATGKKGNTLLLDCKDPFEYKKIDFDSGGWAFHIGSTCNNKGYAWGKYWEYKKRLDSKYNTTIFTT